MANEITLNAILAYADSEKAAATLQIPANTLMTITTKKFVWNKMSVSVAEIAIPLGSVSSLGYYIFINRDLTNFINLKTATSGTVFARLDANYGVAMGKFGSGITAPFAAADTAPCQMEYLILSV